MTITLEDYLKQNEELTLKEQENKINHGKVMDENEQAHRRHQQEELDRYRDAKRRAKDAYMENSPERYNERNKN